MGEGRLSNRVANRLQSRSRQLNHRITRLTPAASHMETCSSPRRHVTSVKRSLEPLPSRSPRAVRRSPTSALLLPPEDPSLCCRHIVFSSVHCKTTPVPRHMWRARNFLHGAALTWRHLLANLCTCRHCKSYQVISNIISCV